MGVIHAFECKWHGRFEARVKAGTVPKCPKGCSRSFVTLVFVQAPGFVSGKTRRGDQLVREMASMQKLSDISTSPSRPGGSVADRNRARNAQLRPEQQARAVSFGEYMGALTHRENALTPLGFGNKYDASEWRAREEGGKPVHVGAPPPRTNIPTGTTGVSIERVREGR